MGVGEGWKRGPAIVIVREPPCSMRNWHVIYHRVTDVCMHAHHRSTGVYDAQP
jgi:hypothetical protein